ncbi:MAG: nucleoside triphosphate pyrophosphohydrolase [Ignavibacteriales bacterium CG12_big_fil_rev_8_21_14_0_65_30_8]|nr:MAG: nucleoside triphosphate pyrophosphohydrolase [Ignavibacteriales bacterium CG12_big_fil_rev_8_21_14_0_65_30_8]
MDNTKFEELVTIVRKLRKECPWDKEQTNDSIKAATIEEAYEVVDAIDKNDFNEFKKELGDLLLHIVFHSIMAEEKNKFNINDVIGSIKEKLIKRHPHIFSNVKVNNSDDVKRNWEVIKLKEGRESVLEGIPVNLPSLQKAHRLQEKASKVGFDWEEKEDIWKKVEEELYEMHEAEKEKSKEELEEEIGDVFFALINYVRFIGFNPEVALRKTNKKFINRFNYIEKRLKENGKKIGESNLEEMDFYWNESKKLF